MKRIELLSPAGDLERLKYAIDYGADAVYVGGKKLSLRSAASNFTLEDIKEGADYAHKHNAKLYVTCNIVMHECDTDGMVEYLKQLDDAGADAVIASSPTICKAVKENTKMEAHLSTQQSVVNSMGVNFFKRIGVDRVVLGRECSMNNIKEICNNTDMDIEVFIEGAMCASVSGRCMLSNVMTNRDANRGGCAQSCRWNYDIYQGNTKLSKSDTDFSMSSRDMSAIEFIPQLIESGVASLKIEGRMKSMHYISTVVNAYRRAIDEYYEKHALIDLSSYKENLSRGQNRPVSIGFYNDNVTNKEIIYNHNEDTASHDFVGIVLSYDKLTHLVEVEMRNVFDGNREIEILSPYIKPYKLAIKEIYNDKMEVIASARNAMMKVFFYSEKELFKGDLIR